MPVDCERGSVELPGLTVGVLDYDDGVITITVHANPERRVELYFNDDDDPRYTDHT